MATRKSINVSGNYAAPHHIKCFVHICTLYFKKMKGRTKSYFTFFLKLNDHPTRRFNFVLSRIDPNSCMCLDVGACLKVNTRALGRGVLHKKGDSIPLLLTSEHTGRACRQLFTRSE